LNLSFVAALLRLSTMAFDACAGGVKSPRT